MKRVADELGGEIDRGATQELGRYHIYDDMILSHSRVLKHTLRPSISLWW